MENVDWWTLQFSSGYKSAYYWWISTLAVCRNRSLRKISNAFRTSSPTFEAIFKTAQWCRLIFYLEQNSKSLQNMVYVGLYFKPLSSTDTYDKHMASLFRIFRLTSMIMRLFIRDCTEMDLHFIRTTMRAIPISKIHAMGHLKLEITCANVIEVS